MDFKQIIGLIESSKEFKDFIKKNQSYYVAHVFRVVEAEIPAGWQIGYYSKETDKIVVFEYSNDLVLMHPPQEALKKEEYIQKLDLDKVNIDQSKAIELTNEFLKENYKYDLVNKGMFLLQNLPKFQNIWNVTIITSAFNVINIKLDSSNGKVLHHEKQNLMQWNRKD